MELKNDGICERDIGRDHREPDTAGIAVRRLLYDGSENYAGGPKNDPVGNMQLEVTEVALAQAATPSVLSLSDGTKVDTDETETAGMVVDEVREADGVPVGRIVRKRAVEAGMEGSRVGITNGLDDHASTMIADHAESTVEDHVGGSEIGRDPVTESQTKKIGEDQSARSRHQMTLLFESMQSLGDFNGFESGSTGESSTRGVRKRRPPQETEK